MALGLFDRPSKAETMLRFPELYKISQNKSDFNVMVSQNSGSNFVFPVQTKLINLHKMQVFWTWMFNAFLHSIVLYFVVYGSFKNGENSTI